MTATTKRFYCSFCGKSYLEVDYIVEGCEVNICDKCVDICKATIDNARKQKAATANFPCGSLGEDVE